MKELITAWQANHDLQFVLDAYACAMYIVSYVSKSQRGMSTLFNQACKEARKENTDLKKQVRYIGNKFLNAVEVSAQEAVYLTLQLPVTRASRDVKFINTAPKDNRTFLLKSKDKLQDMNPDSTDIESSSVIDWYLRRPKQLNNWCLADYVAKLDVKHPNIQHDEFADNHDDDPDSDLHSESEEEMEPCGLRVNITLKNGTVIKERKQSRVIRYIRYSEKMDAENHFREKLLLFYPWRHEHVDLTL
jgi:hypothetical protein